MLDDQFAAALQAVTPPLKGLFEEADRRFLDVGDRLGAAVGTFGQLSEIFESLPHELNKPQLGDAAARLGEIAREVAAMLLEPVLSDLDTSSGQGVLAFVNGMGATPLLELYLMYGEVSAALQAAGVPVVRSLVGPYITSLDMAGCSVTLLTMDDELLGLWDAPVRTPGLRWGV